jgi:hypothetical protein
MSGIGYCFDAVGIEDVDVLLDRDETLAGVAEVIGDDGEEFAVDEQ